MTYLLSPISEAHLTGVNLDLARTVRRAIEITSQDFQVFEGVRTPERQRELFEAGASRTMDSFHIPDASGLGHAVDLVPFIAGRVQWQDAPCNAVARAMLFAAKQFAVPVTWGAVWDRPLASLDPDNLDGEVRAYVQRFLTANGRHPLVDRPHFQVPRPSARAEAA